MCVVVSCGVASWVDVCSFFFLAQVLGLFGCVRLPRSLGMGASGLNLLVRAFLLVVCRLAMAVACWGQAACVGQLRQGRAQAHFHAGAGAVVVGQFLLLHLMGAQA